MEVLILVIGAVIWAYIDGYYKRKDMERRIRKYNKPFEDIVPTIKPILYKKYATSTPVFRESNQFMSREDKQEYLQSAHWLSLRKKVHERDKSCQLCNCLTQLVVHHTTYERLGDELLSDLVLLCQPCHQDVHDTLGYDRVTTYKI